MNTSIPDRIQEIESRIAAACCRCGRDPSEVTLIAVSKTKPALAVTDAYACGIRNFGENKPQEMREKALILPGDIRWHMIGHLQTNKVKYVVGTACMIHSVDSLRLAEEISRTAMKKSIVVPILAEVNLAGEESKFGLKPEKTESFIRQAAALEGITVRGLMTVAPYVENPEENRVWFRELKQLSIDIGKKNIDNVNMCELSMGMTGDFETAIEEGATLIRVGTGIFGMRDYAQTVSSHGII